MTNKEVSELIDKWFRYIESLLLTAALGTLATQPREASNRFIDGTLDTLYLVSLAFLLIYISILINPYIVAFEKLIGRKIAKKWASISVWIIVLTASFISYALVSEIIRFISKVSTN